ncbi:MAG: methionine--tRNA ligase [Saprospiraceae bacterium]|nr:methionine--tRNA ligase [Saprospiraceae bacterium]
MVPKRYLVTSALPYANGPLHVGHLAGAYLSADAYVRFLRLSGKDVVYVCGSDEHGAAVTIRAYKEGRTPQDIVDEYHERIRKAFEGVGMSFDIYHRTSAPLHHETSQEFFRDLYANGAFLEQESEQYFDTESNQFLADRYITGTCPKCGHLDAYGDQCENCGSTLSPTELIDPRSTISGSIPVMRKTKHWYLKLNEHEEWLRRWITEGKIDGEEVHQASAWKKHVVGQCKSWLDGGLVPRSITRDLSWGVDVPQEIPGSSGKKLYVWMDAPIGYISATKQWAKDNGQEWEPYWKDEETALVHFVGKDNIVFHCLIFPAILSAKGDYILPKNVPANQFVNLEGAKISTSRNWAVWIDEFLVDLPDYVDSLRYYLYKIMPEQRDSEFTWKGFQDAHNNELVNNLGNFVNRVLVLTNKYYEGIVPDFDESIALNSPADAGMPSWHDAEMLDLFDQLHEMREHIKSFDFRGALRTLLEISSKGNQLLAVNEPWKHVKEDPDGVKVIMNLALQYVTALSVACRPFLPFTSDKLRAMLGLPSFTDKDEFVNLMNELSEGANLIPAGNQLPSARHLFTRIEDEVVNKQLEKLKQSATANNIDEAELNQPLKDEIVFQDFEKLDLRTAKILEATAVPKTKKLLQLKLDLGFEQRTVVSGIAESYDPQSIVGKEVVLVANLAPRKIRGIESQGMVLLAENDEGNLGFVSPPQGWDSGDVVK